MTPGEPHSHNEYSDEEQQRLALNLLALSEQIHRGGTRDRPANLELLCWMHAQLFAGVRDHAGQIRRAGFGSSFLTFGPHRSLENSEVPDHLLDAFRDLQKSLDAFLANPQAENYESSAIRLALWAHARVIGIHPFEDGNGRTSRVLLNWVLMKLGLRPISFDVVKQEYIACLNHYYNNRDMGPLLDLCIRLYPVGDERADQ